VSDVKYDPHWPGLAPAFGLRAEVGGFALVPRTTSRVEIQIMWTTLICLWLALSGNAPKGRAPRRRPAFHHPPSRPHLEALEDRSLLAAGLSATLVADIVPGSASSSPEALTNVNGTLYFGAVDPSTGYGLWKSDGTGPGTVLVKGSLPGYLDRFTPMNGFVFFTSPGDQLWRTDGTTAGTLFLKGLDQSNVPSAGLTSANGKLFFANDPHDGSSGTELWVSDGTTAGTVLLKDIYPGTTTMEVCYPTESHHKFCQDEVFTNSSSPEWLTNLNGMVYFAATDGTNGRELWRSDGTAAGTVLVKNIAPDKNNNPQSSNPQYLTVVNGVLYFSAAGGLWKSDGTAAGTVLVKNVDAAYLRNVNGTLFFVGTDTTNGAELWKSDGTSAGTVLVKDINPGSAGSLTQEFFVGSGNVNGRLYFSANDGVHGREPWVSDGTPAGTVLVKDINPGTADSAPGWFTNVNGLVYFDVLQDPTYGVELWQTDGTPAGTVLVQDIYPGSQGSEPLDLTSLNNKLYFEATDPVHGRELWDPPPVDNGGSLPPTSLSGPLVVISRPDPLADDVIRATVVVSAQPAPPAGGSIGSAVPSERAFTGTGSMQQRSWHPSSSALARRTGSRQALDQVFANLGDAPADPLAVELTVARRI
jgi:ELWxxDGT repeat protein